MNQRSVRIVGHGTTDQIFKIDEPQAMAWGAQLTAVDLCPPAVRRLEELAALGVAVAMRNVVELEGRRHLVMAIAEVLLAG